MYFPFVCCFLWWMVSIFPIACLSGTTDRDQNSLSQSATNDGNDWCDPFSSSKGYRQRDCSDIHAQSSSRKTSGVYSIHPFGANSSFNVFCDFDIDGGGWTVIQRRVDESVNFDREWSDYRCGFGDLQSGFWLGNEKISLLTAQRRYELRIELTGKESYPRYAKYSSFRIGDKSTFYRLFIGKYSGDAGNDALRYHKNMSFTTTDEDHDTLENENCAEVQNGAWWFNGCDSSNLNGLYGEDRDRKPGGIEWIQHPGGSFGLKFTEMKIRAVEVNIQLTD